MESSFYNLFNKGSSNTVAAVNQSNKRLRFSVSNFSVIKASDEPPRKDDKTLGINLNAGVSVDNSSIFDQNNNDQPQGTVKGKGAHHDEKYTLRSLQKIKQLSKNCDKIENAAQDILVTCNAIEDKSSNFERILKKGEGRTMGGSGLTNYQ